MGTSLKMLLLASAAAAASGYPLMSNKRYSSWLPYRSHPPPPYMDPYASPSQEDLVDFYYPSPEPVHYYQVPYYYSVPEYYEPNEPEEEPEQWYVGSNAEANVLFLQNLMLAQLYNQAQKDNGYYSDRSWPHSNEGDVGVEEVNQENGIVYGEPVKASNKLPKEDRDVRELKSLVENRWVDKRNGEERVISRTQMRQQQKPSAYDALKKLLIQQEKRDSSSRQPHKRSYIPNEDSLVEQLGSLKKI